MRPVVFAFVLLTSGCIGRTLPLAVDAGRDEVDAGFRDAGRDGGTRILTDAGFPDAGFRDGGTPAECQVAEQCESGGPSTSIRFCRGNSRWSCIAGQCTWECEVGGRTCERARACVTCAVGPPPSCPGDPCAFPIDRELQIEEATCARDFTSEIVQCFDEWIELEDGTICTMRWLPTGAPRAVLSCGRCQTSVFF